MGKRTWQNRLLLLLSALCVLALTAQTFISTARWLKEPFPGFFVYENLTVGQDYAPGWTGAGSGLHSMDRLVAIDGRELRDRTQLYGTVRGAAAGTPFHYRVMRGAESLELTVPSMVFAFRDWLLSFGMYMVIGLAFLLIGVAPYFNRASSAVALPLCFMVLLV